MVRIDLRISPRIFEKIWNGPKRILWGWGKLIRQKNQKQKISWHCPFNVRNSFVVLSPGNRTIFCVWFQADFSWYIVAWGIKDNSQVPGKIKNRRNTEIRRQFYVYVQWEQFDQTRFACVASLKPKGLVTSLSVDFHGAYCKYYIKNLQKSRSFAENHRPLPRVILFSVKQYIWRISSGQNAPKTEESDETGHRCIYF